MEIRPDVRAAAELITQFFTSAKFESDRGVALIVAAMLDEILGDIHKDYVCRNIGDDPKVLQELFGPNGPLSNFAARIELGYSYGLIADPERSSLNEFRKIRNSVAHDLNHFTFDNPGIGEGIIKLRIREIAQEIATLAIPNFDALDLTAKHMAESLLLKPAGTFRPRAHFIGCGMLLYALLQKRKSALPSPPPFEISKPWEPNHIGSPEHLRAAIQQLDEFWESVLRETDRGMVLIVGTRLEEAIQRVHEAALLPRFNDPAKQHKKLTMGLVPLRPASSQLLLAYGYGLIDSLVYRTLDLLRLLRNVLAHRPMMFSFDSPGSDQLVSKMAFKELFSRAKADTDFESQDPQIKEALLQFASDFSSKHKRIRLTTDTEPEGNRSIFILTGLTLNIILQGRETDLKVYALQSKGLLPKQHVA